jgi:hypothetical protein
LLSRHYINRTRLKIICIENVKGRYRTRILKEESELKFKGGRAKG